MNFERMSTGFVLLCDEEGRIQQVLHDTVGVDAVAQTGHPFTRLVQQSSLQKGLNFLVALRREGAVLDWQMNVAQGDTMQTLHFAGVKLLEGLLIIASQNSREVQKFYEQLMEINNEQLNELRAVLKEQSTQARQRLHDDSNVYNELSRLNNELVTLQRELAKKNAQLANLNRIKSEFLGMAAHDLRNPLAAIEAYSEFLVEEAGPSLSEEHQNFLEIIRRSSDFMLHLVNDLLDVTTIEAGKLTLHRQPVDLTALVARNVALNRALAQQKDIAIHLSTEGVCETAWVDPDKVEQVLNNLISNAIKYSYPGTSITVRLAVDEDRALIAVQDQGQGIPEDKVDDLFQLYGRVSVRGTDGEKSTGLGLAIAQRIVSGHGGRMWLESAEGEGSTFYVSLPLKTVDGRRSTA